MATITKAEFDALPESLKTKFKAEGDGFSLVEEDVEGLKKSKAEILKEKKDLQDRLTELEKFKQDHEQAASALDEEQKRKAGDFEALEKKLRDRITEVEAESSNKVGSMLQTLKTERLKNLLIEKGVLPDRANYALADISDQFDLDEGLSLKLKSGIGDAGEIDSAINGLKTKAAFLFAASGASGSGASGSGANSGSAQTMPKSQWDSLDVQAQAAFIKGGGSLSQ
jgi:hypothetical protein